MRFSKAILWILLCSLALSQVQPQVACFAQEAKETLKAYPLRNAHVTAALGVLQQLLASKSNRGANGLRMSAEARTNTIIVMADEESHAEISDLLKVIDAPGVSPSEITTIVNKSLVGGLKNQKFLKELGDILHVQIAFDEWTDVMLLKGDKANVDELKAVISSMVLEEKDAAKDGKLVRLAWLTPRSQNKYAKLLPSDLEKVVPKLKSLGIEDVGLACQMLARYDTERAEVTGHANINESRVQLRVQAFDLGGESDSYTFHISGKKDDGQSLFEMDICAKLTIGKLIVLAASPIHVNENPNSEVQSVFVVQLTEGI